MGKRKHTKKKQKPKSEWSGKRWRKVLGRRGTTIVRLGAHDEFLADGSISLRPGTTTTVMGTASIGRIPYSAGGDPDSDPFPDLGNLWKALGFKQETTPGTRPGTWDHTFTDNTSLKYWLSQPGKEQEQEEEEEG